MTRPSFRRPRLAGEYQLFRCAWFTADVAKNLQEKTSETPLAQLQNRHSKRFRPVIAGVRPKSGIAEMMKLPVDGPLRAC